MSQKNITGVVAKNSIAYVEAIFECYSNDETVVLIRNSDDERITLTGVTKVIEPENKYGWFTACHQFRSDESLAQIAFTSGTEGEPKGVLLTHEALSDVTERLNSIMEVDESIREYIGIPANFSFGFGRFRAVSAAGGHSYLPEQGFDPLEIKKMLVDGEINAVSAVPSLWRVLLKNKDIFGKEVKTLKWIEIGSQYMSRLEKEELKMLFPNAIIVQHYGLTEASRSSFLRIDTTEGESLESVGKAYGKTEFKISDEGRICIRGPHVARQLLKNGQYVSNVDDENWFHTSDLGRLESEFLYFGGRADDQINAGGIKLSPDNIERTLREKLSIKDGISVAAIPDLSMGHRVLVGILSSLSSREQEIKDASIKILQTYGIRNPGILKTKIFAQFPVTSTNKVQRKQLAQIYLDESETSSQEEFVPPENDLQLSLTRAWESILKRENIGIDDNFFEIGGDSLMAVMATHEMSRATGISFDVGQLFSNPTVRLLSIKINDEGDSPVSSIVTLQKHGSKTPLFCLFGINLYQKLADSLGPEQPAYGIYVSQEEKLFEQAMYSKLSENIANHLAALYCDAIVRQQPSGPYQLAGISFGGVVAVEAAKMLQQRGEEVSLVVLLDSILPSGVERSGWKKIKYAIRKIKELVVTYINSINTSPNVQDVKSMERYRKQAFHKAMASHAIQGEQYSGKVILIKAKDQSSWGSGVTFKEDYGWSAFLAQPPEIFSVNAAHLEMIDNQNAQKVAEFIKPFLLKH